MNYQRGYEMKISWKRFRADINQLAKKITQGEFTKIVCITKGGLIPTYFLSKKIGIKNIQTVSASSYEGKEKKEVTLHGAYKKDNSKVLIIDDIADTGDTIKTILELYPNAHIAVLYKKKGCKVDPTYFVKEINEWVIFPWETN